ncbi:MAG: 3-dehydroquinate synthase [Thermoplasmatales archaeon A-plasma]|nr:MAG: 3-dehydroquinate synthase [Thermoplasmatales archaeon A-plasma]
MVLGNGTTDHILDTAGKYDSVVFISGSSAMEKFSHYIPDLDSIRGDLTKITLNEGDNLKNVRNYQKIVKVLIDRNVSSDSLVIALGCGEVLDLAGFVVSTYRGGMDYIPVPTTLLAQIGNSVSGLAGINFSNHEDVICSRSTPSEIIVDSHYVRSQTSDEIRDGFVEMARYGVVADHSIISMIMTAEDVRSFRESEGICKIIGKGMRIRAEQMSTQVGKRNIATEFGKTIGSVLGEIHRNKVTYGQYMSTGMLIEFFLAERSGISVKNQRDTLNTVLDRFGIKRSSLKDAGIETIVKKLGERFPGERSTIDLLVPDEPGKSQRIEIGKDRLFSLLRSYTELYEFVPSQ